MAGAQLLGYVLEIGWLHAGADSSQMVTGVTLVHAINDVAIVVSIGMTLMKHLVGLVGLFGIVGTGVFCVLLIETKAQQVSRLGTTPEMVIRNE